MLSLSRTTTTTTTTSLRRHPSPTTTTTTAGRHRRSLQTTTVGRRSPPAAIAAYSRQLPPSFSFFVRDFLDLKVEPSGYRCVVPIISLVLLFDLLLREWVARTSRGSICPTGGTDITSVCSKNGNLSLTDSII
ncbi:hypothetical protein Tco_0806190 [Tanacetum coccineum]